MSENCNNNPFAGLLSIPNDDATFSNECAVNQMLDNIKVEDEKLSENKLDDKSAEDVESNCNKVADELIQEVFGLLLNTKTPLIDRALIAIDCETIEEAIFERVSMENIECKVVRPNGNKNVQCKSYVIELDVITYLFNCYCELEKNRSNIKYEKIIDKLLHIVYCTVGTSLEAPEVLPNQNIHRQFLELFMNDTTLPDVAAFIESVVSTIINENPSNPDDVLLKCFEPLLKIVYLKASIAGIMSFPRYFIDLLQIFATIEPLARVLIRVCTPTKIDTPNIGAKFTENVLGAIISLSSLLRSYDAVRASHISVYLDERREGEIGIALDHLCEGLCRVFHSLLKCSVEIRNMTLRWIGQVLEANSSRGQLVTGYLHVNPYNFASDGFMINLCGILLRLCKPFCSNYHDKVPKIDPTYCAAEAESEDERNLRGIHIAGLHKETCLIPTSSNETRPVAQKFGFITECFYLTHRALDLGFRIVLDAILKSSRALMSVQSELNDGQDSGNINLINALSHRLRTAKTRYLTLRSAVMAPEFINLLVNFHGTSAFWLMQVCVDEPNISDNVQSYSPLNRRTITYPMPENVPQTVRCIPEFILENTVTFVCFLRRVHSNFFDELDPEFFNSILTEVIALMESPKRLFNPHLRAQLAEVLKSLLPDYEDSSVINKSTLGTFPREQLFVAHPLRHGIIPTLLEVFVGIEMFGENVQFEQKFDYRRPIYIVMNYLWKFDEHRNIFKRLAQFAEANMEAVDPPLFLRFINLLMNDAVFLLDEAFSNMAQLRQLLNAKKNGEWDNLPPIERNQRLDYLQQIGMMARFDNILGRETISILKTLTSEIKSIFCHPTIVDRIALMLNYLLLQLTGPKNRSLRVKDQQNYEFNPANLVLNICKIYIHLAENENFILAVSQDGRSYNPELFQLAHNVLVRIGGVGILNELDDFSKRVTVVAQMKRTEDKLLTGAPEEFMDPIMMTLMLDPVILPSSNVTVDRQTIARHLLSDQTDPFNRLPLTMDMVTSNVELRNKIEEWILLKKQNEQSSSSSTTE